MYAFRNEQSLHKEIGYDFQSKLFDLNVEKGRLERDIKWVQQEAFKELAQRDAKEKETRKTNPSEAYAECLMGCGKMFSLKIREPSGRYKAHLAQAHRYATELGDVMPWIVNAIAEFKGDSDKIVEHIRARVKLTDTQTTTALSYLIENMWIDAETKQLTAFGQAAVKLING